MSHLLETGPKVFYRLKITRWYLLVEQTTRQTWATRVKRLKERGRTEAAAGPRPPPGIPDPNCLLHLYNKEGSLLRWAPRDALDSPCTTLSEWRELGFAKYELLLSLMTCKDEATRKSNRFALGSYTYMHLSFDKFVEMLGQLRLEDRFCCYIIPENAPVHVYFDLDGEFDKFPRLVGRDQECLNAIMAATRTLFVELFNRPMDTSKLILLDSTSSTKFSWHVHIQSEAFRSVQHLKAFVVRVNQRLQEDPNFLLPIDPAPYSKNQNFRAPYCRKPDPGRLPLLPRGYCSRALAERGEIVLESPQPSVSGVIDPELLWRCHPALAQPGAAYTYLSMPEAATKSRKRAAAADNDDDDDEGALTTENRARKLLRVLAPGAARNTSSSSAAAAIGRMPPDALPESARALTDKEQSDLVSLLCQHLGPKVKLSDVVWFKNERTHAPTISGICASGSAWCITKTQAAGGSRYTHSSNRMKFRMSTSGHVHFVCFCDNLKHQLPYDTQSQEIQEKLLDSSSSAPMEVESVGAPVAATVAAAAAAPPHAPVDAAPPLPPPPPPPSSEERQRALVDFIRQSIALLEQQQQLLPIARVQERWQQHERADDALIRSVFRDVGGGEFANVDVDALLRQYRQRCDEQRRVPADWTHTKTIHERYMDLSRADLLSFFMQSPFVAVQSGQGTNKTGLVLVLLLVLLNRNPHLRVLMLSNRITFADTLSERAKEFDDQVASHFAQALGFRSYTEKAFARPQQKAGHELSAAQASAKSKADRALVETPRLILSPQSLARLFAAYDVSGQPLVPHYDIVIGDEFMEILHIFHTATMDGKRRVVLEQLTKLMSKTQRIIVMDADLADGMVRPMLHRLTSGAPFCKLLNVAKTMPRTYWNYPNKGMWRKKLYDELAAGRKVFVACNSKKQVESILDDALIRALGLRIKGLHGASCAEDRANYTCTVRKWTQLDCLVISPVVSHGVNCDEEHFDVLFIYATDKSTMPTQVFQQANRVRHIRTNEVHMFLKTEPSRYTHLPSTYDAVKSELNQLLLDYERDYLTMGTFAVASAAAAGGGYALGQYNIDISPWGNVRQVLDTLGNELYCHNQSCINAGRLYFVDTIHRLIQETGGEIRQVAVPSFAALSDGVQLDASIANADRERDRAKLQAVVDAPDVDEEGYAALKQREGRHELDANELEMLTKAEWKFVYGIPLSDSRRMLDVNDFAERFGTEQHIRQAKALTTVLLAPIAALRPVLAPRADPIPYQCANLDLRQHTLLLLTAIGLQPPPEDDAAAAATGSSMLRATSIVNSSEQALALHPATQLCKSIVQQLESAPSRFQASWRKHKTTHAWIVEDEALFQSVRPAPDGAAVRGMPVTGKMLHTALLSLARTHLSSFFGVAIRSKRLGRRQGRCRLHQLDRTYWNEWSEVLFRFEPQVFPADWPKATPKKKAVAATLAPLVSQVQPAPCDQAEVGLVVLQPQEGESGLRYQSVSGVKNQCWWRCVALALEMSQDELQRAIVTTLQAVTDAQVLLGLGVIQSTVGVNVSASKRSWITSTRFAGREWGGDAEMRLLSLALKGTIRFAIFEEGVEEVQYHQYPIIPLEEEMSNNMLEVALHYCNISGYANRSHNHYNLIGYHMPNGTVRYTWPLGADGDDDACNDRHETIRRLCTSAVEATAHAVHARLEQQDQAAAEYLEHDGQ